MMFGTIAPILQQRPELAIFLALALGFLLGKIRIGTFKLGPVLGTLFAGILVGQFDIHVPVVVKILFFDLFLFATGYKVGPQFFRGLQHDALPQLLLTLVICVTALVSAWFFSVLMHYDAGTAAGMLAGAFTESTLIGTAAETINRLPLPDAERLRLINNIPVSYTVTYLVGTTSVVWFLPQLAPLLMRINLKEAARKLENRLLGNAASEEAASAFIEWDIRAYAIDPSHTGMTVADFEKKGAMDRLIIDRIRRNGSILEASPGIVLQNGDIIAVTARKKTMFQLNNLLGKEVFDRELLDFPKSYMNIVVTRRNGAGKTLAEAGQKFGQGISLYKIIRMGMEIPFDAQSVLQRGDTLQVAGTMENLERSAKNIGYLDRPSAVTDILFVSLGILIGALIGMLSIKVFGISITLTTSGGALVMGLIMGWLRSRRPTYGKIPEAALWIFDTLGLAVFIGAVGISAGPGFVAGLRQTGFAILGIGLIVAVLPHVIGLLIGHYWLKINPVILLGAQAGAGTNTTALKALQDKTDSRLPVLGYTVPYALGNILLTAWGPVIVSLMK
jgi:putative transport protein